MIQFFHSWLLMQHVPNLPGSGNQLKFAKITLPITSFFFFFLTSFLTVSKSFGSKICVLLTVTIPAVIGTPEPLWFVFSEKLQFSKHLLSSVLLHNENSLSCLLLSLVLRRRHEELCVPGLNVSLAVFCWTFNVPKRMLCYFDKCFSCPF